ncbi:MAG: serine hydroxymethyltransferase [Minisyncoccia bacterium]
MKDKELKKILDAEKMRQKKTVTLIASENYCSDDVREALSSEIVNKYSEGYPGRRYYRGQENADKVEKLCQERALKVFKLSPKKWAVNVQALSGSPANLATLLALVPIGEKVMGLRLDHGGHLTHGHAVSATGKLWKQVSYGVDEKTEVFNYENIKEIAIREKPFLIIAGYTAYPRKVDWKKFREIADACGALLLCDMSHLSGLVAGGAYPSPFAYADVVTTTTHKTLRGPRSALIFSKTDARNLPAKIDKAVFPGIQGGPHMNQIAAVAAALKEASEPKFKIYAKQIIVNAKAFAKALQKHGWRIVSGGTDSHLLLVDTWMSGKGLSGDAASVVLEKEGIIVNKNTIPGETRSPMDPSGLRLGTAAETTRGFKEKDFEKLAVRIDTILRKEISRLQN